MMLFLELCYSITMFVLGLVSIQVFMEKDVFSEIDKFNYIMIIFFMLYYIKI